PRAWTAADHIYADAAAEPRHAAPWRVLLRVRLPMLMPMRSPPRPAWPGPVHGRSRRPRSWSTRPTGRTLPVSVFTLTDRGKVFLGSRGHAGCLLLATLVLLTVVGTLRGEVEERRDARHQTT
ncbi:hypothetical protein ACU686_01910, partial [Yinghuangia aomiensis]